jgi:hypothetical protein
MYDNLPKALTKVKRLIQAENNSRDADIEDLLELSAGKDSSGVTHYRPWFVAARMVQQDPDIQSISEADKVVFTGWLPTIRSWLEDQMGYDASLALTIPPGYSAAVALARACGCGEDGPEAVPVPSIFVS